MYTALPSPDEQGRTMSSVTTAPKQATGDYFQMKRYGDIAVVIPSADIETLPSNLIEPASQAVIAPLRERPPTNLVVDLSQVAFFGSEFISFLLRLHLMMKKQDSELVLCGVKERIRELLRQTALDTLWAIYEDRAEAVSSLSGD